MKIQLLLSIALIVSQLLHAQAPKGPGGKALFKKGDCKSGGVNLNVCIYCEDKELTKNCKEYICTDNGTCTEPPFKKNNEQIVRTNVTGIKYRVLGKGDTTSKLPKGTEFVNGKVTVKSGYKAVYSSDRKMVFVLSSNGNGIKGAFRCDCGSGSGSCRLATLGDALSCGGDTCCGLLITIDDFSGLTMQAAEKSPEKLTWKKVVLPTKSN
ncbi:hypothetical protein CAP36_08430 [Chitinophagaceae bacterium IBVUCB2]|nr:hypothetical protein CAP36_08430 [Chitinophagaceae bacterium IBVUCB2]